ncbi:MAG: alkaline phosphatase family protein, partial [Planctomycetes bacterium]|nr:alkaline phosphatase family protein [Planctomycetota bacterium]
MAAELARGDWRIFTGVMLATDRVQHMFWRFEDPLHPLYDAAAPARQRDAIRDVYRWMDGVIGDVRERFLDANTDLWVLSDHGFASFRTGVNVNTWLVDEGFLAYEEGVAREAGRLEDIARGMNPFAGVDWERTRAYSFGLGKIFLNRRGREPRGIIESPDEAERTMGAIEERLLALRDPATGGGPVVRAVYRGEKIYRGPHAAEGADIVIGFHDGYRVSWDTAAGRAPPGVLVPNTNKWSGDHCSVDPALVPGFLVTNRKLAAGDPSVIDVAPTVLASLGIEPPQEMEGRNLLAE